MSRLLALLAARRRDRVLRDAGVVVGTRAYQRALNRKEW